MQLGELRRNRPAGDNAKFLGYTSQISLSRSPLKSVMLRLHLLAGLRTITIFLLPLRARLQPAEEFARSALIEKIWGIINRVNPVLAHVAAPGEWMLTMFVENATHAMCFLLSGTGLAPGLGSVPSIS